MSRPRKNILVYSADEDEARRLAFVLDLRLPHVFTCEHEAALAVRDALPDAYDCAVLLCRGGREVGSRERLIENLACVGVRSLLVSVGASCHATRAAVVLTRS